jgi:putative protease
MAEKKLVGEITHFFTHINVAVIKLKGGLKEGEKILIEGATTSLEQEAKSMQIEHKKVKEAKKGQSIGLKVQDRVREGDKVFRVKE